MSRKPTIFTRDVEFLIINEVKRRPLLWDTTLESYRRVDLKSQNWDEIAQILGPEFTGEMVRKRFQNMENTFRSNERKIRETSKSGKGTEDVYVPKWEFYSHLQFLRKTCAQLESTSNLPADQPLSTPSGKSDFATSFYFDDNTNRYMVIPPDEGNSKDTEGTIIAYDSDVSLNSEDSLLFSPGSTSDLAIPSCSSTPTPRIPATQQPRSLSAPIFKRPAEDSLYSKRGSAKRKSLNHSSAIMEAGLEILKDIQKQDDSPQRQLDSADHLASFIASRLRSMQPQDREYYENKLMEVLLHPRPSNNE